MDIKISGHQVELGDAFRAHVSEHLNALTSKYFERAISATVTLHRGPHGQGFGCEIVMHVMTDTILKASGDATTANRAFDAGCEKIDTQLRRYVKRLRARTTNGHHVPPPAAPDFDNAIYRIFSPAPDTEDVVPDEPAGPVIVAERPVDVPTSTVADAVMMLDLRNTTALLFRNAGSGALNMVYRRDDGAIGWVEPRAQA